MARKKGLGRGLEALISSDTAGVATKLQQSMQKVNISQVIANEEQPRKEFDRKAMDELAASIEKYGILQPIVVRKKGEDQYEIVAGERRFRAAKSIGLKEVPVVLREGEEKDDALLSIVENVQREDLSPLEEGMAYKGILDKGELTQQELADALGKSRSYIANTVRLLTLDEESLQALKEGSLTPSQGRILLSEKDLKKRAEYRELLIHGKTNVNQLEKTQRRKKKTQNNLYLSEAESRLSELLGTRVVIAKRRKGFRLQIDYYTSDDLTQFMERLEDGQ